MRTYGCDGISFLPAAAFAARVSWLSAKATGLCVPAHGMGRNPTDVHSNVGWSLCTRSSKFPSDDLPYHNLLGMGGRFASKSGYRGSASLHPNRECSLAVLRFVLSLLDQTNT